MKVSIDICNVCQALFISCAKCMYPLICHITLLDFVVLFLFSKHLFPDFLDYSLPFVLILSNNKSSKGHGCLVLIYSRTGSYFAAFPQIHFKIPIDYFFQIPERILRVRFSE